ncbi:MAG: FadR/GntR family transcriptional regulator [Hyphomonadaceae bacterium]
MSARGERYGAAFEPIKTPRAFEVICDQIRARLLSGALKPGMKLPSERELALQFGVSRGAVREAMRTLENAGVVQLHKGSRGGAFICESDAMALTGAIQRLMDSGAFPLEDVTEARVHVMDTIVRLACARGTPEQLHALEQIVDRTEAATREGRSAERLAASRAFYAALAQMTGNAVLVALTDSLSTILQRLLAEREGGAPLPGLVQSRREFCRRLAARDADGAVQEMTALLQRLHAHLGAKPRLKE